MKKRSRAGSEPTKRRRRKTAGPKRRVAPKVAARSSTPPIAEEAKVARIAGNRDEAVEQLSAASDVLKLITSSPGDLKRVFDAILENATRLCEAKFGALWLREGDVFCISAVHLPPSANVPIYRPDMTFALHENPNVPIARMVETKAVLHVADLRMDPSYIARSPCIVPLVETVGVRTFLGVPLLKDNEFIGAFVILRTEVRPFTEKHIALVKNFAVQAVIAIENARLLNQLRQRTTDLTEALEQQTASAEVLRIISSSSGALKPIFEAMLASAMRICEAQLGNLGLYDGDCYKIQTMRGAPPTVVEDWTKKPLRFAPDTALGRLATTKQTAHVADITAEKLYAERDPLRVAVAETFGARTLLAVPMLKGDILMGAIIIYRCEVRPFTEKQIDLVRNFAAQAVIAIENARLLAELRERTNQLEVQSQEVVQLNQRLERRVADQVGEIERMSRLRRFLPPQVADLIVASGTEKQLESHRREITALFCDLRGFTGFSENADPEDVMTVLREYHETLGASIVKYSGTLERYAGDGVMVVFNDPVPVENPALQAVLMALEMRDAIGALTETWRRWGHDIGFGIGISHGFATLGTIGFEGRFDYAAIGTVSNVASRLCDEAKPGQILVSSRVLTKVENAVKVEPVGEFELKGIRRPLAAYNVLGARPQETCGSAND
jgi:class 3 adenylate cyclase